MNEFEKPKQPDLDTKDQAVIGKTDLPSQKEMRSEFESHEEQYDYLQNELTNRFKIVEVQFESDYESLNKKITALRKKQMQLWQLGSLLDDPKEGWFYKSSKEQIGKKIAELEIALTKISPKKVGIIGFRKKVEDMGKTAPLKQQIQRERDNQTELDRKTTEGADSNKRKLSAMAQELDIEEPVTKDEIDLAIQVMNVEVDNIAKQQEQMRQKFISQRDSWPIVGLASDGQMPEIKQVEIRDKELGTAFEVVAYGGNAYLERTYIGTWPSIPEGTLGDRYGVSDKAITFGAGEKEGKRYIIFRQLQNIQNRGGYPYTALLDPGEEVRQKSDFNDATIIRNILADPVLKNYIFNEPEKIFGMRTILLSRLEQSYLRTTPRGNTTLESFIQDTGTEQSPVLFDQSSMVEPTSEILAQAIATLPEEKRKRFTFLIRGAKVHGQYFGARNVWDAER